MTPPNIGDTRVVLPPDQLVPAAKVALRRRWARLSDAGRHPGSRRSGRDQGGDHGGSTALTVPLVVLIAVLAIAGLPAIVRDLSTIARGPPTRRRWSSRPGVTGAQVHLDERASGSEAPRLMLDGVNVMFEGGPRLGVLLDGVVTHEVDVADDGAGWRPPTSRTGYLEPFPLHYRVEEDGGVVAMADQDLEHWASGGGLWLDLGLRPPARRPRSGRPAGLRRPDSRRPTSPVAYQRGRDHPRPVKDSTPCRPWPEPRWRPTQRRRT